MEIFQATERTRVCRVTQRATYDKETVYSILDEALVVHVGFVADDQPYFRPMALVRVGDSIFLHGPTRARMLEGICAGNPICATATRVDGLLLARPAFHHSMNYRSVAIVGRGHAVDGDDRALAVLEAHTEKLTPGRWPLIRQPNAKELKTTRVAEIPIVEVSAKVKSRPPRDDEENMPLPIWAGSVPIARTFGPAQPDPQLSPSVVLPDHVRAPAAKR